MLNCEINTPQMEKKILAGAKQCFKGYSIENNKIHAIFEHGQWWVRFFDEQEEMDRTYSVIDAEGIGTYNGFDYEEV
ncbi:MAG: hypothetical protein PHX62_04385 [Bacilli bacterium]|jgi:hypothetical protein|nr:hypothetical protein [Bacilli bacterium]